LLHEKTKVSFRFSSFIPIPRSLCGFISVP